MICQKNQVKLKQEHLLSINKKIKKIKSLILIPLQKLN